MQGDYPQTETLIPEILKILKILFCFQAARRLSANGNSNPGNLENPANPAPVFRIQGDYPQTETLIMAILKILQILLPIA